MLRTIRIAGSVLAQGTYLGTLADGQVMIDTGTRQHCGMPVQPRAVPRQANVTTRPALKRRMFSW